MAVDGKVDGKMYHSESGLTTPWWIVDLGEVRTIHQVQIFTRQDCCSQRFHDVEVRVGQVLRVNGDLIPFTLMSTYDGPYDVTKGHIICNSVTGVIGRFLGIQKISNDTDHLQLSEVKVYATKRI
ncbi:fucolectin-like [Macrobrachium nipponense]|uniref:fucolectin-like n=1 Tax=Macrobrachium nipponense TaxID=159736 RepID=UPI0030C8CAA1